MKKIAMALAFLASCAVAGQGHCQEGMQAGAGGKARAMMEKKAHRTDARNAFSGNVVRVDVATGALLLKERGNTVGFDASNPVFSGYRSLSEIRTGDRVAVSYAADGLRVTRLSGRRAEKEKVQIEGKERVQAEKQPATLPLPEHRTPVVGRLIKRQKGVIRSDFEEADIKKDGKITPVGLSVVIKEVTMDEFKQFDKKSHGYLTKAEFLEAVKHLRAQGK